MTTQKLLYLLEYFLKRFYPACFLQQTPNTIGDSLVVRSGKFLEKVFFSTFRFLLVSTPIEYPFVTLFIQTITNPRRMIIQENELVNKTSFFLWPSFSLTKKVHKRPTNVWIVKYFAHLK